MQPSEIISICWVIFLIIFAAIVFFFADRNRNSEWIERMGAIIFAAVVITAIMGSLTPKFIAFAFDIAWVSNSWISNSAAITGMIVSWIIFSWGLEWLVGLMGVELLVGVIGMII